MRIVPQAVKRERLGRHHVQESARLQHPPHFAKRQGAIVHMLENVVEHHQVEARIGKRNRLTCALLQVDRDTVVGSAQSSALETRLERLEHRASRAVLRERYQRSRVTTSDVENRRTPDRELRDVFAERLHDEESARILARV